MAGLFLDLAYSSVRVLAETLWEYYSSHLMALLVVGLFALSLTEIGQRDRLLRWIIWLLAVVIVRWRIAKRQITFNDLINELLIGIATGPPFLR
jgi:hypothetical protein